LRSHIEAKSPAINGASNKLVKTLAEMIYERGESYKGVAKMVEGYFEDMNLVFNNLANSTASKSKIAIIVGCSRWSGVVIPTDLLIADQAVKSGRYRIISIDIVRYKGNAPQQMALWGRYPVRESVITLERV